MVIRKPRIIKMKKPINIRIDQQLLKEIQQTGEKVTAFLEKAAQSRLKWIKEKTKRENYEKKHEKEIMAIIEAARAKWKNEDY